MDADTGEALRRGLEQAGVACAHPELMSAEEDLSRGRTVCRQCGADVPSSAQRAKPAASPSESADERADDRNAD